VFAVRSEPVRTLSERDAAALVSVTAELVALDDAEPFPSHFLRHLAALVHSQDACYCEMDRGREIVLGGAWWAEGDEGSAAPEQEPDDGWKYWLLRQQHPVCGYRERVNDWTTTRKASDFVTQRQFRRTEIWNELYRDVGINHWLDVGLEASGKCTRMLIFTRDRGDFDERDRLVLELLQPHLQRRYDRIRVTSEAVDALATLEERPANDPRHVVLCSPRGVIEFASPESRRLLAAYLQCLNGRVPDSLLAALQRTPSLALERDGRRLTIRAAWSVGLLVLLLGEEDVRLERLTARQRTILEHVARGETDAQIADRLGIASATVNKHLENIFERLGVHNRVAAAALLQP
jgi:DNA-binding CsgD family transcriptional regulator